MSPLLWIGTSWKMTKTIGEAQAYVRAITAEPFPADVQPFVLPAHTSLAAVRDELPVGTPILLGTQNAHWGPEGAGTGEISMRMAADAGAQLVEMGHSERRESFGETDETVALKARAALDAGLVPLVCVGEPEAVRSRGDELTFIDTQVRAGLSRVNAREVPEVIVAYEPVWAIGERGRPATPAEVAPVMAEIRRSVEDMGEGVGCRAILYGGSVSTVNAGALLEDPSTDGLFVGRAAWDAAGFRQLVEIAARSAAHRRARPAVRP